MTLTAERLRELLDYDPETGVFRRRVGRGGEAAGAIAGRIANNGHRNVTVDGKQYLASRLAWLYVTGAWPQLQVDHRNVDPADDRFENLREATESQNKCNQRRKHSNTSGHKGVCFDSARGKWMARIKLNGRNHYLGRFDSREAAAAAYARAAPQIHGEFARVG